MHPERRPTNCSARFVFRSASAPPAGLNAPRRPRPPFAPTRVHVRIHIHRSRVSRSVQPLPPSGRGSTRGRCPHLVAMGCGRAGAIPGATQRPYHPAAPVSSTRHAQAGRRARCALQGPLCALAVLTTAGHRCSPTPPQTPRVLSLSLPLSLPLPCQSWMSCAASARRLSSGAPRRSAAARRCRLPRLRRRGSRSSLTVTRNTTSRSRRTSRSSSSMPNSSTSSFVRNHSSRGFWNSRPCCTRRRCRRCASSWRRSTSS